MRLTAVDELISHFEALQQPGSTDPKISAIVAQHLLIVFHREVEGYLNDLFREKIYRHAQPTLHSFLGRVIKNRVKRLEINDLKNILKEISPTCKEKFEMLIESDSRVTNGYSSLVVNRNHVAHPGNVLSVSLSDFKEWYAHGHFVLDHTQTVLQEYFCDISQMSGPIVLNPDT